MDLLDGHLDDDVVDDPGDVDVAGPEAGDPLNDESLHHRSDLVGELDKSQTTAAEGQKDTARLLVTSLALFVSTAALSALCRRIQLLDSDQIIEAGRQRFWQGTQATTTRDIGDSGRGPISFTTPYSDRRQS